MNKHQNELTLSPIAYIRTDFPTKFGLPRQSGIVPELCGRIVFLPEYSSPDALRGLDGYSHIWLIWGFSESFASRKTETKFSPTVRPPRLGGNTRVGVFATRSPNRPNPVALSCVKLIRIEHNKSGDEIVVSGIDMADGTPIYDIKPYLPAYDCIVGAKGGFASDVDGSRLDVVFSCGVREKIPPQLADGLCGVLAEDPRPQYQHDAGRTYGFEYAGYEIEFSVDGRTLYVNSVEKILEK